jgi:hypothetical protein
MYSRSAGGCRFACGALAAGGSCPKTFVPAQLTSARNSQHRHKSLDDIISLSQHSTGSMELDLLLVLLFMLDEPTSASSTAANDSFVSFLTVVAAAKRHRGQNPHKSRIVERFF